MVRMMKRTKLYKFSAKTLMFEEARWTRTKLVSCGLIAGIVFFCSLVMLNQQYGDVLGMGIFSRHSSLQSENQFLKDRLNYLTHQLEGIQKQLSVLGEKGNDLRLMVDLPKLDNDVLHAGTGGVDERIDFTSSSDVNNLFNKLQATTDNAEREIQLQLTNYHEVTATYDKNKIRFEHLPALKPMAGLYNRNDFGMRLHPVLHFYRKHEGVDIVNAVGTSVFVAADGIVSFTGHESGYGITVQVDHGYSLKTVYGHLSQILVHEGQKVKRGEIIARSGNTGLSNGPHLHYEVRVNGVAQNPVDYFFDDIEPKDFQQ
jgi:murein DD-endopeptidase MepM/ murein hydrolase activator NlpD